MRSRSTDKASGEREITHGCLQSSIEKLAAKQRWEFKWKFWKINDHLVATGIFSQRTHSWNVNNTCVTEERTRCM